MKLLREHPTLVAVVHRSAMGSTEHEGQESSVLALNSTTYQQRAEPAWRRP